MINMSRIEILTTLASTITYKVKIDDFSDAFSLFMSIKSIDSYYPITDYADT